MREKFGNSLQPLERSEVTTRFTMWKFIAYDNPALLHEYFEATSYSVKKAKISFYQQFNSDAHRLNFFSVSINIWR